MIIDTVKTQIKRESTSVTTVASTPLSHTTEYSLMSGGNAANKKASSQMSSTTLESED